MHRVRRGRAEATRGATFDHVTRFVVGARERRLQLGLGEAPASLTSIERDVAALDSMMMTMLRVNRQRDEAAQPRPATADAASAAVAQRGCASVEPAHVGSCAPPASDAQPTSVVTSDTPALLRGVENVAPPRVATLQLVAACGQQHQHRLKRRQARAGLTTKAVVSKSTTACVPTASEPPRCATKVHHRPEGQRGRRIPARTGVHASGAASGVPSAVQALMRGAGDVRGRLFRRQQHLPRASAYQASAGGGGRKPEVVTSHESDSERCDSPLTLGHILLGVPAAEP